MERINMFLREKVYGRQNMAINIALLAALSQTALYLYFIITSLINR